MRYEISPLFFKLYTIHYSLFTLLNPLGSEATDLGPHRVANADRPVR